VSRRSILSMHSRGPDDSEIPLRGYFLSVGGALFALLCAAGWLMPGPPPSGRTDPAFEPAIRIHSALKGPELVVIDTNQPISKMPAEPLEK
jgi:hypothetical protein